MWVIMDNKKMYRHYKAGQLYEFIDIGLHTETSEEIVIYKSLYDHPKYGYGKIWLRPANMFFEEVFYNDEWQPRFKLIE